VKSLPVYALPEVDTSIANLQMTDRSGDQPTLIRKPTL